MIPEKVFQQILALGDAWRVTQMSYHEKEQRMEIRIEDTPALRGRKSVRIVGARPCAATTTRRNAVGGI